MDLRDHGRGTFDWTFYVDLRDHPWGAPRGFKKFTDLT